VLLCPCGLCAGVPAPVQHGRNRGCVGTAILHGGMAGMRSYERLHRSSERQLFAQIRTAARCETAKPVRCLRSASGQTLLTMAEVCTAPSTAGAVVALLCTVCTIYDMQHVAVSHSELTISHGAEPLRQNLRDEVPLQRLIPIVKSCTGSSRSVQFPPWQTSGYHMTLRQQTKNGILLLSQKRN
jgi:hypothetical protein